MKFKRHKSNKFPSALKQLSHTVTTQTTHLRQEDLKTYCLNCAQLQRHRRDEPCMYCGHDYSIATIADWTRSDLEKIATPLFIQTVYSDHGKDESRA